MIRDIAKVLKNRFIILSIIILLLLSVNVFAQEWLHPDWEYRKKVTIDNNRVYEDFTSFPMIVELDDEHLAANAQADEMTYFLQTKTALQGFLMKLSIMMMAI